MLLVRDVAAEQQVVDLVVVAEAVLGGQIPKVRHGTCPTNNRDERTSAGG